MALVVRRIHDAVAARRVQHVVEVFGLPLDFSENRVQRMLQRPVERISLRRPQLVEIAVNALAGAIAVLPVVAAKVAKHLFALEDGL